MDSKRRTKAIKGDLISFKNPRRQMGIRDEEMFALRGAVQHFVVSEPVRSIDGADKSTPRTSVTSQNGQTQEQLTLPNFQTSTSSVRDFLASLSALLGSEEVSKTVEAHSFMRYAESYGLRNLGFCYLKMLPGYFQRRMSRWLKWWKRKLSLWKERIDGETSTLQLVILDDGQKSIASSQYQEPTDGFLQPSYARWMNWGMTVNGKCLTARTLESRRIGSEYSLSDILEAKPDPKYFLSENAIVFLTEVAQKNKGKRSAVRFARGSLVFPEVEKST